MDLKKKFSEIKEKIKPHAPAIILTASTGTSIVLAIVIHRLKAQHAAEIEEWVRHDNVRDNDINIPDKYVKMLEDGHQGHLTSPFYNFCIDIQKHPEED